LSAIHDYLTICCKEQWQNGLFFHIACIDDTLQLAAPYHWGMGCLPVIDSHEKGFTWDRLRLTVHLPQDCGLRLFAHCSDLADWSAWDVLRESLTDETRAAVALADSFGDALPPGNDCLLRVSGRYLWIAFVLTATGGSQPLIDSFSLRMAGDHMTDYLPAIYQNDDFTWRFVSIFNSIMQDMEDRIEGISRQLYAESASPEMLEYLAQWVCLTPETDVKPSQISSALVEYETMYTPGGIKRSVYQLTGHTPLLIEHFMVDPNRADCCNPVLYRRLYGEEPYRFFVLLDENTFPDRERMEWFLQRMEERIPAGSELELILLKQCVQLDWHTYLGINSRIGNYIPAVINETVTIHYDTIIGGA